MRTQPVALKVLLPEFVRDADRKGQFLQEARAARRVPRLYFAVGARLLGDEILETARGFPVLRKARVPAELARPRGSGGNGGRKARPGTRRPPDD